MTGALEEDGHCHVKTHAGTGPRDHRADCSDAMRGPRGRTAATNAVKRQGRTVPCRSQREHGPADTSILDV